MPVNTSSSPEVDSVLRQISFLGNYTASAKEIRVAFQNPQPLTPGTVIDKIGGNQSVDVCRGTIVDLGLIDGYLNDITPITSFGSEGIYADYAKTLFGSRISISPDTNSVSVEIAFPQARRLLTVGPISKPGDPMPSNPSIYDLQCTLGALMCLPTLEDLDYAAAHGVTVVSLGRNFKFIESLALPESAAESPQLRVVTGQYTKTYVPIIQAAPNPPYYLVGQTPEYFHI
ncbi:MAG: hypothetical protein WCT01_02475 [Candidatus Shapirobacteria bacterium]|jgi:hypothetical protein